MNADEVTVEGIDPAVVTQRVVERDGIRAERVPGGKRERWWLRDVGERPKALGSVVWVTSRQAFEFAAAGHLSLGVQRLRALSRVIDEVVHYEETGR